MVEISPFATSTAAGIAFNYDDPRPAMIDLRDTIHRLSRESRWANNIQFVSYTVAQHSLLVAEACQLPASRPYALLHDAAEAYTRDLPTPFKLWLSHQGADVMALEHRILACVFEAFAMPRPSSQIYADVHQADQRVLATEWRDVVAWHGTGWQPSAPPLPRVIKFKPQPTVAAEFETALHAALAPFRARRFA